MISTDTLQKAVTAGIITATQRDRLVALERIGPSQDEDDAGEENLRLIGGGNDLFVTVGTILLSAGVYFVLSTLFAGSVVPIAALMAVSAWLVAEIVTRQHRMKLASTVLSLIFMVSVVTLLATLAQQWFRLEMPDTIWQVAALRGDVAPAGYLLFGGAILAAVLYFLRFRVPILAGIVAISATCLVFLQTALLLYDGVTTGAVVPPSLEELPQMLRASLYMPLICGLVVFGVGVLLDLRDRNRQTIWSDCAFWLHVVSAPMLVHPLFILATGRDVAFGRIEPDTTATILLVALIASFVYIALAIDRRSLLAPTLAYFGSLGIYYLMHSAANTTGIPPFALILLAVGTLVIFFGAGWQRIRRLIIGTTLPTSVLNRLPPIKA